MSSTPLPTKRRSPPPAFSKRRLRGLYQTLFNVYGAQGWWPTTPASSFAPVYAPGRTPERLTENERFEICLGAFLTQNTNWSNVEKVLALLARERKLSAASIERLGPAKLERFFRSSGYFRQKAHRVRSFLAYVKKHHHGRVSDLLDGKTLDVRGKLLALNGIGRETADSMLLYAGGHPIFVVDAYTRRIGERWGWLRPSASYDEIRSLFEAGLPRSSEVYGEMHALLVKLAKEHCRTKPVCEGCPVRSGCATGRRGGNK